MPGLDEILTKLVYKQHAPEKAINLYNRNINKNKRLTDLNWPVVYGHLPMAKDTINKPNLRDSNSQDFKQVKTVNHKYHFISTVDEERLYMLPTNKIRWLFSSE